MATTLTSDWPGMVARWKTPGPIYWAENKWITMAFAVTDDPTKFNTIGVGPDGETFVLFVTADQLKAWDGIKQ